MKVSGNWRPLLDGDLAAKADDAVNAIADALAVASPHAFGLGSGGTIDLALFYGYLARTAGAAAHGHLKRTNGLLDNALEAAAARPIGAALYSGFTGVAWALEHLSSLLEDDEPSAGDDDMNEEIDETLLTALAAPWTGEYDLISGLVGFGVYALERVQRPSAVSCLAAVVDRLEQTAVS